MWIVPPVAGLIEPSIAPEFYVDGIGGIEFFSGCVRAYLYQLQMPLEAGAAEHDAAKILQVKLTGPLGNVPHYIGALARCCIWSPPAAPQVDTPPGPRLVKG